MACISKCRAEATGESPSLGGHVLWQEIAFLLPKHSRPGAAGGEYQIYREAVKGREQGVKAWLPEHLSFPATATPALQQRGMRMTVWPAKISETCHLPSSEPFSSKSQAVQVERRTTAAGVLTHEALVVLVEAEFTAQPPGMNITAFPSGTCSVWLSNQGDTPVSSLQVSLAGSHISHLQPPGSRYRFGSCIRTSTPTYGRIENWDA